MCGGQRNWLRNFVLGKMCKKLIKRSGLWYSLAMGIAFGGYHGIPLKDGGGMKFLPDLISSRFMTVLLSSQKSIRVISCQETTYRCAAAIVPGQFLSDFKDSEESPNIDLPLIMMWCGLWNFLGWQAESVCRLLPELDTFPKVLICDIVIYPLVSWRYMTCGKPTWLSAVCIPSTISIPAPTQPTIAITNYTHASIVTDILNVTSILVMRSECLVFYTELDGSNLGISMLVLEQDTLSALRESTQL